MTKSIVHLEDVVSKIFKGKEKVTESCYVELNPFVKRRLFAKAIKASPRKTLTSLSKTLKINRSKLAWSKDHPIGLNILRKISDFLLKKGYKNFSLQHLEKHIILIKARGNGIKIFNPHFPFNFATKAGIRILSRLYHDGGVTKDRRPFYSNSNEKCIEEFERDVRKIFGNIVIKTFKTKNITKIVLSRLIGDILKIVGYKLGSKIKNNPTPPRWILSLDKNLLKEFVRVAMDDDGSVGKRIIVIKLAIDITNLLPSHLRRRVLKLSKKERIYHLKNYFNIQDKKFIPNILVFDKKIIEKCGIKCNKPKLVGCYTDYENRKIRLAWEIYITDRKNMKAFLDLIGFRLLNKSKKLTNYVSNVQRIPMKRSNYLPFLLMVEEIQKQKGYVTNDVLALRYNLSKHYIEKLKLECKKRGWIKETDRKDIPIRYILTKRGKRKILRANKLTPWTFVFIREALASRASNY